MALEEEPEVSEPGDSVWSCSLTPWEEWQTGVLGFGQIFPWLTCKMHRSYVWLSQAMLCIWPNLDFLLSLGEYHASLVLRVTLRVWSQLHCWACDKVKSHNIHGADFWSCERRVKIIYKSDLYYLNGSFLWLSLTQWLFLFCPILSFK